MIRRRTAAVALVASLVGPALVAPALVGAPQALAADAPAAPGAGPAGCAGASEETPVVVEVRTLAPRAPQREDQPFQVAGRVLNCGSEPLRDLQVRLGVGARLDSRSLVRRADEEPVAGGRRLSQPTAQTALPPGGSTDFDLRLPVSQLRLGRANGVFPLTVQARARVGTETTRLPVGLAHTFVPWFPDGPIAPTRVAWLLPLVDEPHRGPADALLDDELDGLLEDDADAPGRLQRVLLAGTTGAVGACDPAAAPPEGGVPDPAAGCRGEAVPMTYAVDPDLVHTVEAMTRPDGYRVLEGGEPVPRPTSENAVQWLAALRQAAAGTGTARADVLALPYGDPDVAALTRTDSPVKDDVEALRRLGTAEAQRLLEAEPLRSLAWLPPGPLGGSVDALAGGEVDTLLVDEAALPEPDPALGRTPNARTTLATSQTGDVGALVVDGALSALLEPDPSAPGWQGARLAEQRWIAEIAALSAERPSTSRTFVVAPRRGADLLPSVVAAAVSDTGRLPWLCPVRLADAAAGTERCAAGGLPDAQGPAEPDPRGAPLQRSPDDQQLSAAHVQALGEVRAASDQFTEQVLLAGTDKAKETKARLLRARGRASSTAWRDAPGAGRRVLELLAEEVASLRSRVRLLSQPVLLTGSGGTISLTVQNELDQPVNVAVGLPSSGAARLESSDAELQVVPPSRAVSVEVRVEARTSGRFTVQATLLDADGRPFGERVPLAVRSTQYGRVALAVTGIATAVLLVAAGVRITRRALRRTPAAPAPVDEPVVPAAPGSGV